MFIQKLKWALLWALLIFILCAIPGHDIPHISFLELLNFDKLVHAGIFFILVLFLSRGFRLQDRFKQLRSHYLLFALAFSIPYGGLLEIMQGTCFVERTADWFDFLANSFGCILAALLYNPAERLILKRLIK